MYLSQIKINNFRIFDDFSVILNEGMNLLVGENNSGKTALIDAIRYTLGTTSREWIQVTEDDFHRNEMNFLIQLKFEKISNKQASVFVEHLTHEKKADGSRISVLYINFVATLTDQTRRGYRYIKTEIKSGKNGDGPRVEKEIREFLATTYLKPLRDVESEMTAGRGSRLSQILAVADELAFETDNFNKILDIFTTANQDIIRNDGVSVSTESIKKRIKDLTFTNDSFSTIIDILDGKNPGDLTDIEKRKFFRTILEKFNLILDGENPLQGLGFSNMLFIATELLLLHQESEDFSLLLIEEPEAHLHPQLQMRLLQYLRNNYNSDGKPSMQMILSTHSPNFASKAHLENVILMTKPGKAFPLRKGETELEPDDYVFLEKFLDVTKSNLFFAKGIIVVEGDAENILLPTIAELIGRPLENYGVSIVNVGNTAFSHYARILQRKSVDSEKSEVDESEWIPIKVACLRDMDLWPDEAEKKEENEPYGYLKYKNRNKRFWRRTYSVEKKVENADGVTTIDKYIADKKSISGQNVKVYLSDYWTFEYDMALAGLFDEVKAATEKTIGKKINIDDKSFNSFIKKSIYLYKKINEDNSKTEVAYQLAISLREKYQNNGMDLSKKLPKYIVDAIEFVTEKINSVNVNEKGE